MSAFSGHSSFELTARPSSFWSRRLKTTLPWPKTMTQAQYSNLSSRSQHISPMTQRTKKNQWSHHSRIFSKKTGQAASVHDCKLHSNFFSKEGRRHRIFIPEPLVLATKTPIYISTCPRLDRLLFDKDKEDLLTSVHKISIDNPCCLWMWTPYKQSQANILSTKLQSNGNFLQPAVRRRQIFNRCNDEIMLKYIWRFSTRPS